MHPRGTPPMSITTTLSSLTQIDRTFKAQISAPYGGTYALVISRERILLDANGNQVGNPQPMPPIAVNAPDIAAQAVTVNGVTLTFAQLQAYLQAAFDQLAATAGA